MSSPLTDDQVKIIYLDLLSRYPSIDEILYIQNSNLIDPDARLYVESTNEYLIKIGKYLGDVSYNRADWSITVNNLMDVKENYHGITLANGKLAMLTRNHHNPIKNVFITRKYDFNNIGQYANNVVEAFNHHTFSLGGIDDPNQQVIDPSVNMMQSLNMRTGVFKYCHDISLNGMIVSVDNDVYPLRTFPFSTIHTMRFTCASNITIEFSHFMESPKSIRTPKFTNSLINTNNTNYYFFSGAGEVDEGKMLVCTSTYLFPDTSPNISYANKGFNLKANNMGIGFNKFTLNLVEGVEYKLHILSTVMTQYDFLAPEVETQRILINLLNRGPVDIRLAHVNEWAKQWTDNIDLEEKTDISADDLEKVRRIQKHITFALFNIYSAVRDDVNVEINPLNLSVLDLNGHIFWSAELFLIPFLIFLKHRAAKGLISYRYSMLENAKKLAMAHGFKGGRFPYQTDVVGYQDMYWDTASPLYVYNTALIAISVWNYYRVTKDMNWLVSIGYTMMKEIADFFCSKAEKDSNGNYHITNVLGMNHIQGDDNAMTNYFARMALKYTIEATYELNYRLNPLWLPTYKGLQWIFFDVGGNVDVSSAFIIKLDSAYGDDPGQMSIKILETLIILYPYYSKDFYAVTQYQAPNAIEDNIAFNMKYMTADASSNYWNNLLLATLRSTQAQQSRCCQNSHLDDMLLFEEQLDQFINLNTFGPWEILYNKNLPIYVSAPYGYENTSYTTNDIAISAMFLMMFLVGFGGLRVNGGLNAARFYYEEFQIVTKTSNVLPQNWKSINISGVGAAELTFNIVNKVYKPNTC